MIYLPPSSLIQEISKSLASIGLHQGKKSKKRKEKKTIKAVDEEVDMFADQFYTVLFCLLNKQAYIVSVFPYNE